MCGLHFLSEASWVIIFVFVFVYFIFYFLFLIQSLISFQIKLYFSHYCSWERHEPNCLVASYFDFFHYQDFLNNNLDTKLSFDYDFRVKTKFDKDTNVPLGVKGLIIVLSLIVWWQAGVKKGKGRGVESRICGVKGWICIVFILHKCL